MDTDDLMVCVDCSMFLANGEVDDHDPEWPGPDAIDALWPDHDIALGDDHDEFSWSSCDACGSTLGGARYAAVAIPNATA